nr:dihydrolipoamide acetyltransferase family protein [Actinomadura atramentaria]
MKEDLVPGAPPDGPKRQPVLVGYGVKPGATKRRPRKAGHVPAQPRPQAVDGASARAALATPPVRKMARDLGVDLTALRGTGPNGSITRDDIRTAAGALPGASPTAPTAAPGPPGTAPGSATTAGAAEPSTASTHGPAASAPPGAATSTASAHESTPATRGSAAETGAHGAGAAMPGAGGSAAAAAGVRGAGVAGEREAATAAGGHGSAASAGGREAAVAGGGAGVAGAVAAEVAAPEAAAAPARTAEESAGGGERVPVRGVRRAMAAAMVESAFTAPHVTEFLQVDVTETMDTVARLRALPDFADVKVSPLLLVAKALVAAVRRHPHANASYAGDHIAVHSSVNLGIAAATDRGLIVPNIKDAQALSLVGLARALGDLTARARAGKCSPADLTGGTITITNVGVFGVDAGTPILTPGEAAILAFGQIRDLPWVHEGELAIRKVTTLALSFDHRALDGAEGSAVLRDVGAMLADPLTLLAHS